jgi:REP element-mobilizing transposase RayT
MLTEAKGPNFLFDKRQKEIVKKTVKEVCENRNYFLHAVNVLSNHVHIVVSAQTAPEKIFNAFKTYSTRNLRQQNFININTRVWSRGGSRRYLWKQRYVDLAIEYVLYGQGDIFAELDRTELHTR